MVQVFIQVLADLRPSAVVENALGIVSESLHDLARLGSQFDLLCPTPLFARLALTGDPRHDLRLFELVTPTVCVHGHRATAPHCSVRRSNSRNGSNRTSMSSTSLSEGLVGAQTVP
jgi:hypothetical protein